MKNKICKSIEVFSRKTKLKKKSRTVDPFGQETPAY